MLARVKRRLSLSWTGGPTRREKTTGGQMEATIETGVECETFHRLEDFVGTEKFLEKLKQEQQLHQQQGCRDAADVLAEGDARTPNISELMRDGMSTSITTPTPYFAFNTSSAGVIAPADPAASTSQPEDLEYVMIDKQSAVEAMAFFIAQTLMNCPQAFTMPPAKLQEAIIVTIQGMKQSKFKRLCTAGRHAYRWSALGYSAFQMYSNPWICQAILQAVWAFSRMTMRTWV